MTSRPNFYDTSPNNVQGAVGSFVITPHATEDLPSLVRAITIDGAGTISWVDWWGAAHVTAALPQGTYPMLARAVRVSGTSATGLTGWV